MTSKNTEAVLREALRKALRPYLHDHITPTAVGDAVRDVLAIIALSSPSTGGEGLRCGAGAAPFRSRQSLPPALQDWLGEVEDFLKNQHDIRDGAGGQQLPNKAMSLSIALKEALGEEPWA